ncbi:MAG TPA: amidohydrolase [Ignavibacteria bacterium]|nr:amidohydrolase [Ignavibacteria bacterium]HRF66706.1 amidohydrolase [Ignavibacteria bacterium]HRJ05694.1 amidohydrolase [Ignavibacteria bacterium]
MSSTLYINAKVWQPDGSYTESFGVKNGHFDFSGSNAEADTLKDKYSKITDLKGKLVLPGLIDGHLHLVNGGVMMKRLDCSRIDSVAELKSAIEAYVSNNKVNWVIGGNLDLNKVFENHDTTRGNIIDDIFSELPLYITNYDYHSAICNSKAFALAGIDAYDTNLPKDEIEISSAGKLTGFVTEGVMYRVYDTIPPPSLKEKCDAVYECIKMLHSYGITSVGDITLPGDIDVYLELYRQNKLSIRINSYIPFDEFENLQYYIDKTAKMEKDYFSIVGFKAFWDGALGSETALFSQNYKGRKHNGYTTEIVRSGRIYELAEKIDAAGKQMIIHAIGDKAVSEVLELYAGLPNTKRLRHRIEHAQHIQPEDMDKFGEYGVIASVQPLHLKYDARTVFEKLPARLIPHTHNYYHITKAGGIMNFGTDFPIVEADPIENIRLAVTRDTKYGEFTPEHKIPLYECLKAYTINNAYASHNENAVGSITNGKVADFVIMDEDIFEMDEESLNEVTIFETHLGGNLEYKNKLSF